MSVLIKTMTNLPEHCYDCPCHDGESGYCQADKEHRYSDYRPFWCPLVEIKDDKCQECKKDWTKCTKCPVMMEWVKKQKVRIKNG